MKVILASLSLALVAARTPVRKPDEFVCKKQGSLGWAQEEWDTKCPNGLDYTQEPGDEDRCGPWAKNKCAPCRVGHCCSQSGYCDYEKKEEDKQHCTTNCAFQCCEKNPLGDKVLGEANKRVDDALVCGQGNGNLRCPDLHKCSYYGRCIDSCESCGGPNGGGCQELFNGKVQKACGHGGKRNVKRCKFHGKKTLPTHGGDY